MLVKLDYAGVCSPRTWGWSVGARIGSTGTGVLPTHVGMVVARAAICVQVRVTWSGWAMVLPESLSMGGRPGESV